MKRSITTAPPAWVAATALFAPLSALSQAQTTNPAADRPDAPKVVPAPEEPAQEVEPNNGEASEEPISGERQPMSVWGEMKIETMEQMVEREKQFVQSTVNRRVRNGRQGEWQIPSRKIKSYPHSGLKALINRWGDRSMGIGLGAQHDVQSVWVASQGGDGIWAEEIRFVGFRDGVEVGASEWFKDIDREPSLMPIGLSGVDRVVVEAKPGVTGAGFYALDDLSLVTADGKEVVIDFEDAEFDATLTDTDFQGFTWEVGTGSFDEPKIVPAPEDPSTGEGARAPGNAADLDPTAGGSSTQRSSFLGGGGTAPTLLQDFLGPRLGDNGANAIPPDTCGAVGQNEFVAVVNSNMSIYNKTTGARLQSLSLQSFFGAGVGDPRVTYDFTHDRWVVIATDFGELCYFAYSLTSDPRGAWLKTSIDFAEGTDTGRWIDYPTLGVDSRGIFIEAYMVTGQARMTIFAIDKAPLLAATPTLGTVTAFRNLAWDGAIQHATQYTDAGASWMISTRTNNTMFLRRINEPLTNPTLSTFTVSGLPTANAANDAPALGSTVNISTGGTRLMNACYVNGSIWTTHTVASGGRSGVRWYEIDPVTRTLLQTGVLNDPSLWFYYPSIAADADGNVVLGFSGSDANTYPSAYFSGREADDTDGQLADAVLYSAGQGPYTVTDGAGRNRWGDYSLTTLDPVDGTFWTIQERTRAQANRWTTRIAQLEYANECGDISNYCTAVPNPTGGTAQIAASGSTSVAANDLTLVCVSLPPGTFGIFFYGQIQAQSPVGDGNLCLNNPFFRLPPVQASAFGDTTYPLDLTNLPNPQGQIMVGETWNFSFWYRQVGPAGFNFSNGLEVEFCD